MSNDLKKILNKLECASGVYDILLTPNECSLLFDYITLLINFNKR